MISTSRRAARSSSNCHPRMSPGRSVTSGEAAKAIRPSDGETIGSNAPNATHAGGAVQRLRRGRADGSFQVISVHRCARALVFRRNAPILHNNPHHRLRAGREPGEGKSVRRASIVLPEKNYSLREIGAILVRRRWLVFLPLAAGPGRDVEDGRRRHLHGRPGRRTADRSRARRGARVQEFELLARRGRGARPDAAGARTWYRSASERERRWRAFRRRRSRSWIPVVVFSAMALFVWSRLS